MAYSASNLSVLAYANNFTLWHYTTTDANVTDSGYFNSAVSMLRKGDFIIVNVDTDGTPANKFYVVTGNTGSAVSLTVYS
ncbi:MAG: hypothetical protein DYH13_06935 [Alphaproteobacteria bacterium PRO2]|nr:hypothetical protein [Alphaproteobacteria bacterium PRO2]